MASSSTAAAAAAANSPERELSLQQQLSLKDEIIAELRSS
jgi:hypothetical protein